MSEFEELPAVTAGKRLGMNWAPWMGDWFVSHSPRNWNSHGEGQWDHWVDLAVKILQHPATDLVRPEAYSAVQRLTVNDFDSECNRRLTDEEAAHFFGGDEA